MSARRVLTKAQVSAWRRERIADDRSHDRWVARGRPVNMAELRDDMARDTPPGFANVLVTPRTPEGGAL